MAAAEVLQRTLSGRQHSVASMLLAVHFSQKLLQVFTIPAVDISGCIAFQQHGGCNATLPAC
jgi:hypothetical protein